MPIATKAALAGLVLSGLGVAACLYLSLGLKLIACPLCIYQRSFIMAVFGLLTVGWLFARHSLPLISALSIPLVFTGLGVAAYHEYLVVNGTIECPLGFLGVGSLPAQSLMLFVILAATSITGVWSPKLEIKTPRAIVAGLAAVLGLLLAWASVAGSPPIPVRTKPYDPEKEPFNNCRPVYREATASQ